ncbi:neuropeptide Y receptor type 5 [Latimeria chalumnae]|uniref:Neuropeptide Y receptor type 5 n=1 Tax=Latimeria chalumnae TaxID=7897 RepID=Q06B55_LATCH|nr:PREDICTED: neuropeptide Y receptor type 5 [Latimeria chalumnae]ABI94072.1 neuropeptide Y receptor Y5 [Latimeria chalumnae]|eukprot:XP_006007125.1 PREDICTED: neuropeptide Y receptor type 5 [Latimeria chalumnae]
MEEEYKNISNVTATEEKNESGFSYPSWEDYKSSSVDDIRYFLIGLYAFVSLLGLFGNLLILTTLIRKWKQNSLINFLIGNLAFSDILVVTFCSPFTLTGILLDQWIFGEIMCHIVPFLQCVSVMVSTLMLMCIAMVRFHMVSHPLSKHLTVNTGYLLLGTLWTLGFTICSPLPVFHKIIDLSEDSSLEPLKNMYLCIESWPSGSYRIAFTICLLFVQYILPLVCLTVSHTSVCRSVSSRMPSKKARFEENEMINLTLQQPEKNRPQAKHCSRRRWSYSLVRKHRKRYSKKRASVVPAILKQEKENTSSGELLGTPNVQSSHASPTAIFLPGVPICFEAKPDENPELQKMLATSKSISRIQRRSRQVFYKLTIVVLVFAISWMPLHIFQLATDFNANLISNRHFKLVYCICHLLGMLSCCLNPILYGLLNNGIKSDLLSLIKCSQVA